MECKEPLQQKLGENDDKAHVKNKQLDSGYAWATVIGAFFINFISKF